LERFYFNQYNLNNQDSPYGDLPPPVFLIVPVKT
jgi:hypothetical protein